MPRIRSLKPELLEDSRSAALSHAEWRMFVSAILLADDYGNFRATPARVAGVVFWSHPREDVASLLDGLAAVGLLSRYEVDGQAYARINGWAKHQKVDHPGKPLCPGPEQASSRDPRETLAKIPEPLAPDRDRDRDQDRDQDQDQDQVTAKPATVLALASPPRNAPKATRAKPNTAPSPAFEAFWSIWPLKVKRLDAFKAWTANGCDDPELSARVTAAARAQGPFFATCERDKVPHAATWLKGHRWLDEVQPPRSTSGRPASPDPYANVPRTRAAGQVRQ